MQLGDLNASSLLVDLVYIVNSILQSVLRAKKFEARRSRDVFRSFPIGTIAMVL